jgi:hypothetical protein
MGVTYLLEFLSTLTNEEFEYEVPLLLDTKSRLHTTASRAIIISDNRSLMLEEAKEAFKNCIAIDDKNSFAAYHLSIVYYFLQMKSDRDFFATKAKEYGDSTVQRSIICCNALWNLKSESKKEVKSSIRQLDSLSTLGFIPATRNLRIYEAVEKQSKLPEEAFSNTVPNWLKSYNDRPSPLILGAGKPIFLDAFVKGSGRLTCKLMPETEGFSLIYRWKVGTSVLNQTFFKMGSSIQMTKEERQELVTSSKSVYQCSNQTICSIGNLLVSFDDNNTVLQIQRIER